MESVVVGGGSNWWRKGKLGFVLGWWWFELVESVVVGDDSN